MSSSMRQSAVLVGVSGSRASAAALRWAAAEARRRSARLRVVRTWDREFTAAYAPAARSLTPDQQRGAACEGLAAEVRATFGEMVPDAVAAELKEGMAERTLVELSADADLLVLGSGSPADEPAGPVVRACLSHAHCPVVVVRPADQ
ncbi:MAG: universal stress protein [Actinomycetota bacterium]|nr:universal stress protein [Actinomycetota bacterium]